MWESRARQSHSSVRLAALTTARPHRHLTDGPPGGVGTLHRKVFPLFFSSFHVLLFSTTPKTLVKLLPNVSSSLILSTPPPSNFSFSFHRLMPRCQLDDIVETCSRLSSCWFVCFYPHVLTGMHFCLDPPHVRKAYIRKAALEELSLGY